MLILNHELPKKWFTDGSPRTVFNLCSYLLAEIRSSSSLQTHPWNDHQLRNEYDGCVCKVWTQDPENFDEEVKSLVSAWFSWPCDLFISGSCLLLNDQPPVANANKIYEMKSCDRRSLIHSRQLDGTAHLLIKFKKCRPAMRMKKW